MSGAPTVRERGKRSPGTGRGPEIAPGLAARRERGSSGVIRES